MVDHDLSFEGVGLGRHKLSTELDKFKAFVLKAIEDINLHMKKSFDDLRNDMKRFREEVKNSGQTEMVRLCELLCTYIISVDVITCEIECVNYFILV